MIIGKKPPSWTYIATAQIHVIPPRIKSDTILNENQNEKDHLSNPDAITILV
jgi:hypothetical protein